MAAEKTAGLQYIDVRARLPVRVALKFLTAMRRFLRVSETLSVTVCRIMTSSYLVLDSSDWDSGLRGVDNSRINCSPRSHCVCSLCEVYAVGLHTDGFSPYTSTSSFVLYGNGPVPLDANVHLTHILQLVSSVGEPLSQSRARRELSLSQDLGPSSCSTQAGRNGPLASHARLAQIRSGSLA